MDEAGSRRPRLSETLSRFGVAIFLVLLIIAFSAWQPDRFPTTSNFINILAGIFSNPTSVMIVVIFLLGLVAFAKPREEWFEGFLKWGCKVVLGIVHLLLHLVAIVAVHWWTRRLDRYKRRLTERRANED